MRLWMMTGFPRQVGVRCGHACGRRSATIARPPGRLLFREDEYAGAFGTASSVLPVHGARSDETATIDAGEARHSRRT